MVHMSCVHVVGAVGGAGSRGCGVEGVLVMCGTTALVGDVVGVGGGCTRDGAVL